MSTSVAYLRKRLADIGRHDLLEAAERGEVSTFAAAEEAGLVTRREVTGNGSPNQAKKRAWALARITRQALPLAPKPEPEFCLKPAPPKFSQATRDIIARLVEAGRADLVIAVTERRISPFAAARIADRGERRRVAPSPRGEKKTEQQVEPEKPEAKKRPALDVRALIG
jgi:hypothetical protein